MFLKGDHVLADLLPERDDDHQVRLAGGDLFCHVRLVDVWRFDAGDVVFLAPEGDIGGRWLAAMPAGRSRGLGEHADQFVAAVMYGFQARDAKLC